MHVFTDYIININTFGEYNMYAGQIANAGSFINSIPWPLFWLYNNVFSPSKWKALELAVRLVYLFESAAPI